MSIVNAIDIRPFHRESTQEVIKLWQECDLVRPWNNPEKDIQRKLSHSPELFFLAWLQDRLVGSCMAGYDGHRGWIYYLGVIPDMRNKGIGKKMIQHAQEELANHGCPKINLMVRQTNTKVIQFYKTLEFSDDPVQVLSKRLEDDTQNPVAETARKWRPS